MPASAAKTKIKNEKNSNQKKEAIFCADSKQ